MDDGDFDENQLANMVARAGSSRLTGNFGRLDLLAVIMPLSLVVAYGAWLAKRSNSSSAR